MLERAVPNIERHNFLLLLLRVVIGAFFITSSTFMILDYYTMVEGLKTIALEGVWIDGSTFTMADSLPDYLSVALGYSLPWAMMLLGVLFLLGLFTRIASLFLFILMGLILLKTGLIHYPITEHLLPFHPNIVTFIALFGMIFSGGGRYALDALFSSE